MNTSEAQEVLKNARAAYDKGDISREDALESEGRKWTPFWKMRLRLEYPKTY